MSASELLRFPATLQRLREGKGFHQRLAAQRAGLTQSVLCALERGRLTPTVAAVAKVTAGWELSPADAAELDWARAHDDIVREAGKGPLSKVVPSLSVFLSFTRTLSARQCLSVQRRMERLARIAPDVLDWTDSLDQEESEVPMR
jgi:transcriptional regulator with XRE-family HTH domain